MSEPGDLASLVRPEWIFSDLSGADRRSILRSISERLVAAGVEATPEELFDRLLEREELGSTCVGPLVAIPHCKLKRIEDLVVSIGISREQVAFGGEEDGPVQLFFTVLSPEKQPAAHLQSLSMISRWIQENGHVEDLIELERPEEILAFIRSEPEE